MGSVWSAWLPLDNVGIVPDQPICYQIRHAKNGLPQPIPRWFGIDPDGILYVGHSREGIRIKKFVSSFLTGKWGHNAARRHFEMSQAVVDGSFGPAISELEFRVHICMTKEEAQQMEKMERHKYKAKYGEVPPMNSVD